MSISEDLIDRLAAETGARLTNETGEKLTLRARARRRRALETITECCVTVTEDGHTTWDESFLRPPTLGDLVARCGKDAFVVAVVMRRRTLRDRMRRALAAA